jgi:mycothiol synthase
MYGATLLGAAVLEARALGARQVVIDVEDAGEVHDEMAIANGLRRTREVLRMWRELPIREPWSLEVRPFVPGQDDDAWIEVNNRAFTWHPDQADFTPERLAAKMAEPWFDADGFLLTEVDGRLAGFCWTKIHADERPPLGEIFVIAVDPAFAGRGLGRALVLAGLDWLTDQGLRNGILYVEGTNDTAIALYEKLGFEVTSAHRWWTIDLADDRTGAAPPAELSG